LFGSQQNAHVRAVRADLLLEREGELRALEVALEASAGSRGRLLLIEGPAGIGKSSLLDVAIASARARRLGVLKARGSPLEREFAFGVVRQLLASSPVAAGCEREDLLTGDAALAAPLLAAGPDSDLGGARNEQSLFGYLHGLYWLVATLAERGPLLLSVDDAHWADEASVLFLHYLAQRLDGLEVILLVALREGEPWPGDAGPAAELRAHPDVTLLRPARLSDRAVAELVRKALPDAPDEFCDACSAATAGNPFYLRELLTSAAADGVPPTASGARRLAGLDHRRIARSVLARLGRMPTSRRSLATAVAIAGDGVTLRDAAELAVLAHDEAAAAADELAATDVLLAGEPLSFAHPIVREAIYADVASANRADLHLRAARLFRDRGTAPETIAAQLLGAGRHGDAWVVTALREAAREARARGAQDAAASFLRRALEEPPGPAVRPHVLHELGASSALSGDAEGGITWLTEASQELEPGVERATAALMLAQLLLLSGQAEQAVHLLERTLSELPASEVAMRARLETYIVAAGLMSLEARSLVGPNRAALAEATLGQDRLLLAARAMETALGETPALKAVQLAERALDGGRLLAEEGPESPAFQMAATALHFAQQLEAAHRILTEELANARMRASLIGFGCASCWRSDVNRRLGRIADAEADARAFFDVAADSVPALVPVAMASLAEALGERGELQEARSLLDRVELSPAMPGPAFYYIHLPYTRARVLLECGEREEALASLRECERLEEAWEYRTPATTQWRADAAIALREADPIEARRLAAEELERARAFDTPLAVGVALRAAGLVAEGGRGRELLGESVAVLEPSPAHLDLARSLVELGAALRRANRRREAREPLARGMDLARRCGALALAERAHHELRATGARPRKLVLSGAESLTASELRVCELAADGLSNPEIAQQLYLTRKTVETHLGHAYRKLGISSRDRLTAALEGR
jgi:ATP/maltotriose-dependent transcriptional regulator MalT